MIPESYKILDGCHNCSHSDFEESLELRYFCLYNKSKVPLSSMDITPFIENKEKIDPFSPEGFKRYSELLNIREKWEETHRVSSIGICDNHKPQI